MKVGSLFAGVGGFDLGLELAGHEVIWQAEIDKHCRAVLRRHWPTTEILEDVKDVRRADGLDTPGLICGGFPCQDLSVAGRREGLEGARSGLWWEFHRILGDFTGTDWALIENVPGLLSSNGGEDFAVLLRSLGDIGFRDVAWRLLDSRHFGVPQRRRRLFILATRDPGAPSPAEILALTEGSEGDFEAFEPTRSFPPRSLPESTGECGGEGAGRPGPYWDGGDTSDTLDVSMLVKGQMMPEKRRCPVVIPFRKAMKAHAADDYERWEPADEVNTLTGHGTTSDFVAYNVYPMKGQGKHLEATETELGNIGGRYGASERGTRVVAHSIPRRMTPRETERLQGFPDDWTSDGVEFLPIWWPCPRCEGYLCMAHGGHVADCDCPPIDAWDLEGGKDPYGSRYALPDSARYRAMGNAVTVNVAEWIGWRIARYCGLPVI